MVAEYGSGYASWYLSLYWGVETGSSNISKKLGLWGAWPYGRNWLASTGRTGLTGRRDRTGRDKVRLGVSTVAVDVSVSPPLSLEVLRAAGSGGCHQFHWCCWGCRVFVSVKQINHNMLHTNIVQDSTKSIYNTIVIWNPTKCTKKYNILIINLQKKSDTKIECSHPYIVEIVEIMPKYWISGKITANFCWGIGFILCKNSAMNKIKYHYYRCLNSNNTFHFNYTGSIYCNRNSRFKKRTCISHFWPKIQFPIVIYTTSVIRLQIWNI